MSYRIYHDKVNHTAKFHRNTCGACNDGQGMHGHQVRKQNEWYGPFVSKELASQEIQAKGIDIPIANCGLCKP
jgi:hypothetical protein